MNRSSEPAAAELPDSTRQVALARLPERLGRQSPRAPRNVTSHREFQDGEVIPGTRYRVTSLVGAGGMGCVYEVEHVELGKRFVLKSLLRELSRRQDLVGRMRNEWRALARLDHPNIVNVTDAGTSENGVPFFVMERLDGETLARLIHRQRRLQPPQALAIAAGMLEGLHAAHQIGIVHRDVKPSNVILIGPTTVKVLDFGIAKIRDAKDVITARGIAVGTPRYMSPEQAQGTPVDARSDVYATGLILFEMVSGVGPFDDARDNNELLLAHIGRQAPLLSSISVVAPELDALVASMLAKDPRERPADARVVAEMLRALCLRYADYPTTDSPTLHPRPAQPEVPTRVDGPRRQSPPTPALRPDGVAARVSSGETTTQQPAFEIATTAAHTLPRPNVTLRLDEAAPLTPPSLYGSDTLVDAASSVPTAVPGSAPERTELLLAVPPTPSGRFLTEPGPTRTAVPLAEAPNLTPPPVVPALAPPPKPRSSKPLALAAFAGVVLIGAVVILALRAPSEDASAPTAGERAQARKSSTTAADTARLPAARAIEPAPATAVDSARRTDVAAVPERALIGQSASALVPSKVLTARKDSKTSTSAPDAFVESPAASAPASANIPGPARAKAPVPMPGSGL